MTNHDDQLSTLFPLFAIGITVILAISIYTAYLHTANMKATVIIPGGVTYLGR